MKKRLLIIMSLIFVFAIAFTGAGITGKNLLNEGDAASSKQEMAIDALTTAENQT